MANKVTGSTDTSGALSIAQSQLKSVLVVGVVTGTPTKTIEPNKEFSISSTSDVKDAFGNTSIMVGIVKTLISNGVNYINGVIVSAVGETDKAQKYQEALDATLDDSSIKCVVFDSNVADVITACKTHLALCESNDLFRYAVIAPTNTMVTQTELIAFAKTINDSRVFVPGPAVVDTSAAVCDGTLVSAGLAALIMTETDDPALPMNGVQIKGFGGVSRAVLTTERDILASNGVTALYTDGSMPTVHRLVTSEVATSGITVWQEGTTRFIADYVLETIEKTLHSNYKRTKNVTRVLGDTGIRGTVKNLLLAFEDREIIENFDESTLTVVKDPSDMYGALVDYEFDVVTPLYTITINQHMKL